MTEDQSRKPEIIRSVLALLEPNDPARPLVSQLLARPPAEDLAAFDPSTLAGMAGEASALLARQRRGGSLVELMRLEGGAPDGGPLTVVTIVHDDMPFLFDSAIAEIADTVSAIHAISHPVLSVRRGTTGGIESFEAARASEENGNGASPATERVSLIQVAADSLASSEAEEALAERLQAILAQVTVANTDFTAMRARVREAAAELAYRAETAREPGMRAAIAEAADLIRWLTEENFIFLGLREFRYFPEGEALRRIEGTDLGILRDSAVRVLRRDGDAAETTPEVRAFLEDPSPLIVAKANARSLVHRRVYMDYVGIKRRNDAGELVGELRIVGLFTSSTYTRSVFSIPYLRQKAQAVIDRFGFHPRSHSAKALTLALETYSRDEMFQIDTDLLEEFVGIVTELGERPRIRVLPRIDRFDRFVSVLVFVPREAYDSKLRDEIGRLLADAYDGHVSAYYPAFPEGALAQVHFIVGRSGGATPRPSVAELEAKVTELARDWMVGFERAVAGHDERSALSALAPGLPEGYRELVSPEEAVIDAERILALQPDAPLRIDFEHRGEGDESRLQLKLYHLGSAMSLSRRVPILENLGFSAVSERTFEVTRSDGAEIWLHDMELVRRDNGPLELSDNGLALEDAFAAVADGRIENDGFNALVLVAGLSWREANVLRAYARYLRQIGLPYTTDLVASVLERHPEVTTRLLEIFKAAFDPAQAREPDTLSEDLGEDREAASAAARGVLAKVQDFRNALEAITSLDDDRIARRLLSVLLATLRTNYFAIETVSNDPASKPDAVHPALAFKLDPHAIDGMPQPAPYREIFVFDARVEGVHLRFGPVARGGLRWSDRSQDYRTEVLGLVKAQQVKNAVIVPVGSKGGFYPKRLPDASRRDEWFEAGRSAYIVFIASLLSVTDNIVASSETVTPERVLRYDDLDPYFVVAADKGTATFSDTANAVAIAKDFWLGDAFASGGSAGYDHKGMGITARGAWEAVKRHFREMDRNIQTEAFTVAGCGDMSGDVFGNGMLLSPQTKLVAAFDHRHIFIDPNPDPATSLTERQRLFALPRSSWGDYDKSLLSEGGGIFSRQEKRIRLSREAAEAIGWDKNYWSTTEIFTAILKSPVDLLWFGGIGTYIRASAETNLDVGDRANDPVRITGRDVRAKVVGEGANLGVTQRGRIEYASRGGRINTDAIDNSAGVNTSDVEVNIKIALRAALSEDRLTLDARNRLLASMTEDVGELVLANNYEQTLAISLEQRAGAVRLPLQARFMAALEEVGILDREVETLPGEAALADLRARGQGLTRPEIAVLLAYGKIDLFNQLAASDLPDDPYLEDRLLDYFPAEMREAWQTDIRHHRLRREIIATGLANDLVNRLGPSFATAMREATGRGAAAVTRAFIAGADGFEVTTLLRRIDALDGTIHGETQNELYAAVSSFLQIVTAGFTRTPPGDLAAAVAELQADVTGLGSRLADLASDEAKTEIAAGEAGWLEAHVPEDIAPDIARLPLLALIPELSRVSRETGQPLEEAVAAFFAVTQRFRIGRLEEAMRTLRLTDYYELLALERAYSQIARARHRLVVGELMGDADTGADALQRDAAFQMEKLAGTGETSLARLTLAAGLLQEIAG